MSQPKANTITVEASSEKSMARAVAEVALSSYATNGLTTQAFTDKFGDLDIQEVIGVMKGRQAQVRSGDLELLENMLTAQVFTLNALFNKLAQRSGLNMGEHLGAADTYMRLALKAQSQCRSTIEAINEIKNPSSATFVRQANIGNAVQVNNGANNPTSTHAGAHARMEKTPTEPNKLLAADQPATLSTFTGGMSNDLDSRKAAAAV
jgi:hypothetical protein